MNTNEVKLNTHRINRVQLVPECHTSIRRFSSHHMSGPAQAKARQLMKRVHATRQRELIDKAERVYDIAKASVQSISDPFHAARMYYHTMNECLDEGLVPL